MLTVYGAPLSPFVRKVLLLLEIKGIAYDNIPAAPGRLPEGYLDISPLGKIPAIRDGDLSVSDSSVIVQYLEEKYPQGPTLLPATPEQRARARWLEEYADTKLLEVTGLSLFMERLLKPVFFKQPTDEARVQKAVEVEIPKALTYLETQAPATGFLFGDNISLADISVGVQFINARIAGYIIDPALWPKTAAWFDRICAHPAVIKRQASEQPMVAMLTAGR